MTTEQEDRQREINDCAIALEQTFQQLRSIRASVKDGERLVRHLEQRTEKLHMKIRRLMANQPINQEFENETPVDEFHQHPWEM